mmetsp:Transcript_13128/g.49077  ORF Transcript_13128/g.49077 Transcript_13128/m.49077 type:complete len:225 (+) Transcript_13128:2810-3484(+)
MSCSSFFQRACISKNDSPPAGTDRCFNELNPPIGMLPLGASAPKVSTHVSGDGLFSFGLLLLPSDKVVPSDNKSLPSGLCPSLAPGESGSAAFRSRSCLKISSRSCRVTPPIKSTITRKSFSGSGGTPGGLLVILPSTLGFRESLKSSINNSLPTSREVRRLSVFDFPDGDSGFGRSSFNLLKSRKSDDVVSGSPSAKRLFSIFFASVAFQLDRGRCAEGEQPR